MTTTPAGSQDIMLQFAWNEAIEDLYASWHRQVTAAEHLHQVAADRLRLRHLVVGSAIVVASTMTAAGAIVARGVEPGVLADVGIDRDLLWVAVAAVASLAAFLAVVQMFARYATRAEGHRIAALRYGSLGREMAATLTMPREVRREPDHVLVDTRERMSRYDDASPAIGGAARRRRHQRSTAIANEA
jgi:hypothetical protein